MGRLSQESAWRIASWLSWKGKELPVGGAGGGCSVRFLQPRWLRPLSGWAPDHGITKQTYKLAATPSELHLLRLGAEGKVSVLGSVLRISFNLLTTDGSLVTVDQKQRCCGH